MIEKHLQKSADIIDAVNIIFDAIENEYPGKTVYPGNLVSDHLWKIVLPQHFKRMER